MICCNFSADIFIMRKVYLFFAAVFATNAGLGQIEVGSIDFPGKSDTVRYTNVSDLQLDFQAAGPDYTWDFSDLTDASQTLLLHNPIEDADNFSQSLFGPAVLPAYRATFFLPASLIPFDLISNFIDLPIENFYRFFRKTQNEMNVIGLAISTADFGFGARSDTIEMAYQFPITYGQQFESRGYTFLDLSFALPAQFKQYRQRISEVDGWGSITTPYGSFDVLRVHNRIEELDSIFVELNGAGNWLPLELPVSHEYEWWSNGQKGPVLRVVTNEIGGDQQVVEARYRDAFKADLVAELNENQLKSVVVYPNPTSGILMVASDQQVDQLLLFDATGSVVMQNSGSQQIDMNALENGTYFLMIKSGNSISVEQIIKQK